MATVVKAPKGWDNENKISIFLAGSIEMGGAIDWQTQVEQSLNKYDIIILNPRRDDWNSSWIQSIDNPQFKEQVEWEIRAMEHVDVIAMYFAPGTKSPISLLELGLFGHTGKMIVCCPDGFWRKGNVDIVCEIYKIPQANSLTHLIELIEQRIELHGTRNEQR